MARKDKKMNGSAPEIEVRTEMKPSDLIAVRVLVTINHHKPGTIIELSADEVARLETMHESHGRSIIERVSPEDVEDLEEPEDLDPDDVFDDLDIDVDDDDIVPGAEGSGV